MVSGSTYSFNSCTHNVVILQVPWEWNDTTVPFRDNVCIHELFERHVAATPEAECLAFEGTYMTFAEVNYKANQLAGHLRILGVGTDVPVAILMERSFDLIVAMMGMCGLAIHCLYRLSKHTHLCKHLRDVCMLPDCVQITNIQSHAKIQPIGESLDSSAACMHCFAFWLLQ